MAKIRSGNLILKNGQKVHIGDAYIDSTTMSGVDNLYIDSYYGDGTYLTGIPRTLVGLLDTPVTYSGAAGQYLKVKSTEDGIEFVTVSGSEEDYYTKSEIDTISGTLHSQIVGIEFLTTGISKAGLTTVTSGATSVDVTFDYTFSIDDYILSTVLSNTVDDPIDLYSIITSSKTTDGFTVSFSGDVESNNYYLEWLVVSSGIGTGTADSGQPEIAVVGGGRNSGSTDLNNIDYFDIATTGDATDFGDMTKVRHLLASTSNGANDRGIFMCGPPYDNAIDYITISTPANAIDFGDLNMGPAYGGYGAATSNGTNERGVHAGEGHSPSAIHYWTISTLGNTTSFGSLTDITYTCASTSNATNERGVWAGGSGYKVTIEYVTISTTGDSTDFGDLVLGRRELCGLSNSTNERGVFTSGYPSGGVPTNIIEYITISTPSNTTDFGDLLQGRYYTPGGTSNGTNERGVICGGQYTAAVTTNSIEYITISTPANSADFGDLVTERDFTAATSNA